MLTIPHFVTQYQIQIFIPSILNCQTPHIMLTAFTCYPVDVQPVESI